MSGTGARGRAGRGGPGGGRRGLAPVRVFPKSGWAHDESEHDACAIIANVKKDGRASHGNVKRTLEALAQMGHRTGEIEGEGDGAGLQTDIPRECWARRLEAEGFRARLTTRSQFVVAHIMLDLAWLLRPGETCGLCSAAQEPHVGRARRSRTSLTRVISDSLITLARAGKEVVYFDDAYASSGDRALGTHLAGTLVRTRFADVSGDAAVGGTIALVEEGDSITIDAGARLLRLDVPAEELARRRAKWVAPAPRYTHGVLAMYARLVSSSSLGAVTDRAADQSSYE